MQKYLIIWVGEVASIVGSALTSFALGVWIYERTDSVSMLTLNMLAYVVPGLIFTPLAGVIADRWNRKWVMVMGDAGVALTTFCVFLLVTSHNLRIGYVYVLTAVSATFGTLQWPAYTAAIPLIVPKQHLGRASALSQAGEGLGETLAPLIAGSLYVMDSVGLRGILLIDFATFVFSTTMLLFVPIPHHLPATDPETQPEAENHKNSLVEDIRVGWRYIAQRPGLLGLLVYVALLNFLAEFMYPLAQPLLLQLASPDAAGSAMSKMAVGMFIGIAIMMIWGGPKRRIRGILIPGVISGLVIATAGLQPSLLLVTAAGFGYYTLVPIIQGSDEALWQTKVAADVQGRVFAIQGVIESSIRPLALLIAGPLADGVFEPALAKNGLLAGSVGQIIGVGPGRGIALFITILGVLSAVVALLAYLNPRVRHLEDEIPDADMMING
jgi:DHA3 family macrolide efflux protein-like MFS transporter